MKSLTRMLVFLLFALLAASFAQPLIVGVSWANFQEERWKIDERAIREQLGRMGATYISADAQSSSEKQLNDIDALIARGAKALIILLGTRMPSCPPLTRPRPPEFRWWPMTV